MESLGARRAISSSIYLIVAKKYFWSFMQNFLLITRIQDGIMPTYFFLKFVIFFWNKKVLFYIVMPLEVSQTSRENNINMGGILKILG